MNSLVSLGALASFSVSCLAAAVPALHWQTYFEEPAMLLGFVLVGRALEERAKLRASADMTALQVCLQLLGGLTLLGELCLLLICRPADSVLLGEGQAAHLCSHKPECNKAAMFVLEALLGAVDPAAMSLISMTSFGSLADVVARTCCRLFIMHESHMCWTVCRR